MVFHGHFYNAFLQFIEADWFPVVIGSPYTRTPPYIHTHTHKLTHTRIECTSAAHKDLCTSYAVPNSLYIHYYILF